MPKGTKGRISNMSKRKNAPMPKGKDKVIKISKQFDQGTMKMVLVAKGIHVQALRTISDEDVINEYHRKLRERKSNR